MDTKKIQAWLSQHKFEVGLFALVLGVIAFVSIRNRTSTSGKQKATLDTLHNDLVTVDFDLNQLMTTSVANPWVSNLGAPAQSNGNVPSQAIGGTNTSPSGGTPLTVDQILTQENQELSSLGVTASNIDLQSGPNLNVDYQLSPSGITGQSVSKIGAGEGRPQSNYLWSFRGMGLEGQQLSDSFFADEFHQLEPGGAGIWGDYNSPVRLN